MKKIILLVTFVLIFSLSSCNTNDDIYFEKWSNKTQFQAKVGVTHSGLEIFYNSNWRYSCDENSCIFEETYLDSDNMMIQTEDAIYTYIASEDTWYKKDSDNNFMDFFTYNLTDYTYNSDEKIFEANDDILWEIYQGINLYVNEDNNVVEEREYFISFVKYSLEIVYYDFDNEQEITLPTAYIYNNEEYEGMNCPEGE